jgi:Mn-dependent DtxR family transcriptional regulator
MTEQTTKPNGRPKSQETIRRDEIVYSALHIPNTIPELATELNLSRTLTYQALNRLRAMEKVEKGERKGITTDDGVQLSKTHVWKRT